MEPSHEAASYAVIGTFCFPDAMRIANGPVRRTWFPTGGLRVDSVLVEQTSSAIP